MHVHDGALAQLGERNTGSVEVSGSIPLGSTNKIKDLHFFLLSLVVQRIPIGYL
jgi:hypothetical protein